jgi:hypothetical protein
MPDYPKLAALAGKVNAPASDRAFRRQVIPYLIDVWLEDYCRSAGEVDIVETEVAGFSYLFDIARGRLIAAWGISRGRHAGERDASRMAGHPLSEGPSYHRGHAIPHRLGGPTDINLVAQKGFVNIGPFRALENQAVATPGALYFTYWIYGNAEDQKPNSVEQGLLCPGRPPDIRVHPN